MTHFKRKILLVEPNWSLSRVLVQFLTHKNYQLEISSDLNSALTAFDHFQPELVILDVNLSDGLAYQFCESLRSRSNVFLVLLSNYTDIESKKKAFNSGVDDYLTKPFDLQELEYRLIALFKRRILERSLFSQVLSFDNLTIFPNAREVVVDGQYVSLTNLEFSLLHILVLYPRRVWTRLELLQQVWQTDFVGSSRIVDAHIKNLRQKLKADNNGRNWIQTVRGVGYRFDAPRLN